MARERLSGGEEGLSHESRPKDSTSTYFYSLQIFDLLDIYCNQRPHQCTESSKTIFLKKIYKIYEFFSHEYSLYLRE